MVLIIIFIHNLKFNPDPYGWVRSRKTAHAHGSGLVLEFKIFLSKETVKGKSYYIGFGLFSRGRIRLNSTRIRNPVKNILLCRRVNLQIDKYSPTIVEPTFQELFFSYTSKKQFSCICKDTLYLYMKMYT